MTYEDCAAEGERLAQSFPVHQRPKAKAMIAALAQFHAQLDIVERCPKCGELLAVREEGSAARVRHVSCPCGECADVIPGF